MCESKKEVLDNLFESRETNLYALTEEDKKKIENQMRAKKDNEKF